jgi:molecular chaperone GrpE
LAGNLRNKAGLKATIKRIFNMENPQEENQHINEEEIQASGQSENAGENVNEADSKATTDNGQAKINELNDKYLRLYSEFDNYRRRTAREKLELTKTAGEDIYKSLLPIVDDFERSIKSMEESDNIEALKAGVSLIFNKLRSTLTSKGLEPMDAMGKPFDSEIHEAITNIPAPSEDMKGKVVDEIEKGYLLNGKVIRHAKVIVGN